MPIKLSVAPQQFVDETGKPLVGRVSFFVHGTNHYADIYTMQGTSFVPSPNPILLDSMGRIPETVFFEADILDCFVQTYIGEPGQMTPDAPGDYWTAYDRFEVGIEYKALMEQSGVVDDIAGLKEIDPTEYPVVQVRDLPIRYYIWDEYATNTPDDGIVVRSDLTGDGRWLLLWDDEMLPSSIYGVKDGNFANLTMCLSYPDVVGSIGLATPPCVRIMPGTYATTTWVSTTKTIAFGKGVKFTGGGIFTPKVVQVSAIEDYVCDFAITDPNSEAHSSWFRTVAGFWRCGAGRLVMDDTNYFALSTLDSSVHITGAKISGTERMGAFTTQSNYLWLEECSFDGTRLFSAKDDYVRFSKCYVTDSLFTDLQYNQWDVGKISEGHHVECLSVSANTFPLASFDSADVWLKFYDADNANAISPKTSVDFQGRTLNYYGSNYLEIRNATIGNIVLPTDTNWRKLYNVVCTGYVSGGSYVYAENSTLTFSDTSTLVSLQAVDSVLETYNANIDHSCSVDAKRCVFNVGVDNATDNETDLLPIVLEDCTVTKANVILKTKKLYMYGCTLHDPYITIWPYHDGANYRVDGAMVDCKVLGGHDVVYSKNHVNQYGSEELNCHHVIFTYDWLHNSFSGSMTKGIAIDFWGVLATHSFYMARSDNAVRYENNVGKCPADKLRVSFNDSTEASQYNFYQDDTWNVTSWYVAGALRSLRAFPAANYRTVGGIFSDFAVHAHRYAFPFGAMAQSHCCLDLMDSPTDYGDFCAVCFVSNAPVGSSAVGFV